MRTLHSPIIFLKAKTHRCAYTEGKYKPNKWCYSFYSGILIELLSIQTVVQTFEQMHCAKMSKKPASKIPNPQNKQEVIKEV